MAQRDRDVLGPWDKANDRGIDWMEQVKAEQKALDELLETSKNLPDGELVGAVISFQKGDGYAYYKVTSTKPLKLAWIPFLDRWTISTAELRGLRLSDVRALVEGERRIAALFGKSTMKFKDD